MQSDDLAVHRLSSQGLAQIVATNAAEVAQALGALQGQDYAGAKWSFGLRLPGSTDDSIEAAIAQKRVVRTWALRGTLHFVAPADIDWLLALIGPRVIATNARRYRELALDEATLARSNDILAAALSGRELDRNDLLARLTAAGISVEGQRGVYMLQRASLDGLIAQSVTRHNRAVFFSLVDLPARRPTLAREEAIAEIVLRYFTGHGPATIADFVWWSGLNATDARAGLEAAGARLAEVHLDGTSYYFSPETISIAPVRPVVLLPGFDELLVGYRDRSASIAAEHHARWSQGNAMFSPTIIDRGRALGLWKRTIKKESVAIEIMPFAPLSDAQREELVSSAEAFGRFLGLRPVLAEQAPFS